MTRFLTFIGVAGFLLVAVLGLLTLSPVGMAQMSVALSDIASQVGHAQTVAQAKGTVVVNEKQPLPDLELSGHACGEHPEAPLIRDCARKQGFMQIWRDTQDNAKFFGICQMSDGRWGLAVFNKNIQNNKTAFAPGSGTWNDLMRYLMKSATRWTKGIPAQ